MPLKRSRAWFPNLIALTMKREPLADYRVYLTVDCASHRVVNTEHYDLRPDRGARKLGKKAAGKEIVIRVQDKDTDKPK